MSNASSPGARATAARRRGLQPFGLRHAAPLAVLLALMACPALALHLGGPWAAAGLVPVATALAWRMRPGQRDDDGGDDAAQIPGLGPGHEATRIAQQVVPVWKRNVDAAKAHSEQSMGLLLESFSGVSGHLDKALADAQSGLQLDLGAADQLLDQQQEHLDRLLAVSRTAARLSAEMQRELSGFNDQLKAMAELTREVQNIGRATHLLALNASVEANRSGSQSVGNFMVVATEVRALAGQSREAGIRLARHVSSMQSRMADLERRHAREGLDDEEEVELRAEQAARQVVLGILSSLGGVTQASRELRQAGAEVQANLEKIFVGLQSQDRLSQMLTSVTDDMSRYSAWLGGATDPEAETPARWLDRLEQSYPMEDLRSSHHGTVAVRQGSTVEFF